MLITLIIVFMLHALYLEIKLSRSFKNMAYLLNRHSLFDHHLALSRKIEVDFTTGINRLNLIEEKINFIAAAISRTNFATVEDIEELEMMLKESQFEKIKLPSREDRYKNMRKAFGGSEDDE